MFLAPLAIAFCLLLQVPYRHERPAFELTLPSQQWRVADQTAGALVNCAFSPTPDAVTRAVVMTFPRTLLPAGLASREEQQKSVAGDRYVRIGMEEGTISGRDATRWEYSVGSSTIVEWAFLDGDVYVVFQLAAPLSVWSNPATKARLDSIGRSFQWIGGLASDGNAARATADETRAARTRLESEKTPPRFVVDRHRIRARIDPEKSTLEVEDVLDVTSRSDDLAEIVLHTSVVKVERIDSDRDVRWYAEPGEPSDSVAISFPTPLKSGESVTLKVTTRSDGFTRPSEPDAPAPFRAYGQIEPYGSFSSHVIWYPIDPTNEAAVEITFDVPAPYVALTGGARDPVTEQDGRLLSRFVEEHRIHRDLPFGFALTDGTVLSEKLESGFEISVHGFGDRVDAAKRVLAVAKEVASLLEDRFGATPARELRIVRITGERTPPISILPGMTLVPSGLFDSIAEADLADGNLSDMNDNAMLVLADAVTRHWTGIGADLSPEWVESLATFAKALLIERRHGPEAYAKTIAFCRSTWLTSIGDLPEYAIGDPRVQSNRLFLPTVGCKAPVVLAMLRERIGDEAFFGGLADAMFRSDPKLDSFVRMESALSKRAGADLKPFFDTWFFRAGAPRLKLEHAIQGERVTATLYQMQGDDAYPIDLALEWTTSSGAKSRTPVTLAGKDAKVEFTAPDVISVVIADSDRLPARIE